jgi:hypothetical protein
MIGGTGSATKPSGRARPADTQRSSAARGNSHLPVTFEQGMAPCATSS